MKKPYLVIWPMAGRHVYPVVGSLYDYTGQLYVGFSYDAARDYRDYITLYKEHP